MSYIGGRKIELERLIEQARQAEAFVSLIDPDHRDFVAPADVVQAVSAFCRRTGQRQPDSPAEVARCIFESLALACARTLERLRRNTGRRIEVLHIVGGGARNRLLCQLTADACGLTVVAGPAEATALGNILVQALGRGLLSSVEQLRQVCRASVELKRYEPHETERWQEQLERFSRLAASAGD
ncbi:MAG: FGGY-family carbohydrate kinase [Phycisphaerae bacterium]